MRDTTSPPDDSASASQSPVRRAATGASASGRLVMNLGTSVVIKGDRVRPRTSRSTARWKAA